MQIFITAVQYLLVVGLFRVHVSLPKSKITQITLPLLIYLRVQTHITQDRRIRSRPHSRQRVQSTQLPFFIPLFNNNKRAQQNTTIKTQLAHHSHSYLTKYVSPTHLLLIVAVEAGAGISPSARTTPRCAHTPTHVFPPHVLHAHTPMNETLAPAGAGEADPASLPRAPGPHGSLPVTWP